jgi:hypothetical protein
VRDRGAEGGLLLGALGIDVDELVILDHVGVGIDAPLIEHVPRGHADLLANHALVGFQRHRRLLPDFIHWLTS